MYATESLLDLSQTDHASLFEGCRYPWEILKKIGDYCLANAEAKALICEAVSASSSTMRNTTSAKRTGTLLPSARRI